MSRIGWLGRNKPFDATFVVLPVAIFSSVIIWFSQNPINPSPAVEASLANPVGLLISNFVYDGVINIENVVTSSVFLLVACLYYPKELRIVVAYLLPIVAIAAGGLAELTAISASYTSLRVCGVECSFYGMSGVASAAVGFTTACFFIAFAMVILRNMGLLTFRDGSNSPRLTSARGRTVLVYSFIAYVLLLLFFSGLLTFPVAVISHQTSGGDFPGPSPPAVLIQTPPVAFVHSASLLYGFLFCVAAFIYVNRRYRLLTVGRRMG